MYGRLRAEDDRTADRRDDAAADRAGGRTGAPYAGQVTLEGQDHFEQTDIPMTVGFSREPSGALVLVLSYDRTQFSEAQAGDVAGHYLRALAHLAADPGADPRPADDFLGGDAALIDGWNATARQYAPVTVHELVLAQALRTPEAPAVVFEGSGAPTASSPHGCCGWRGSCARRASARTGWWACSWNAATICPPACWACWPPGAPISRSRSTIRVSGCG
nr:hypothetical protein GCM10020093_108010 [Planobispora longispora]